MDALDLLTQLEGIRDKIPAALQQDFEDLLARIRSTYEMSIKYVTPPEPVHDGRRNLAAHQSTLEGLCTQLGDGLQAFQQIYVGQGSDTYHARATESLQDLQMLRDHFAQAALLHNTMASNFDIAMEAREALVALLIGLVVTLSVLIASAGTTAPVTVPATGLEVAGGAVSIGLMTEAELGAMAAIMGLLWAALPNALLVGAGAFIGAEVVEHIALHPPTHVISSKPLTDANSGKLFSIMKTTPDGRRIRVRKLSPGEVKRLRTPSGEKFHDLKGKDYQATDEIYEDQDGEYWIGSPRSENIEPFP